MSAGEAGNAVEVEVDDAVGRLAMRTRALTLAAKTELLTGARRLAEDPAVRVIVLTGTGSVFCAGQDLVEHAAELDRDAALDTVAEHFNPIVLALTGAPKPVLAAINGTCAGAGFALAMACDLRVCSTSARFTTAFTGIGLTFDSGLSATLTRAVGAARASELVMLPEPFDAARALEWGLVGRLVQPDALASESAALAGRLAAGPTLAYAAAKQAIHDAVAPPLADVLEGERRAQVQLGATGDHRGAVAAFLAKRPPEFYGR